MESPHDSLKIELLTLRIAELERLLAMKDQELSALRQLSEFALQKDTHPPESEILKQDINLIHELHEKNKQLESKLHKY